MVKRCARRPRKPWEHPKEPEKYLYRCFRCRKMTLYGEINQFGEDYVGALECKLCKYTACELYVSKYSTVDDLYNMFITWLTPGAYHYESSMFFD